MKSRPSNFKGMNRQKAINQKQRTDTLLYVWGLTEERKSCDKLDDIVEKLQGNQ